MKNFRVSVSSVDALTSLEKEDSRPEQLKNVKYMADFSEIDLITFKKQYTVKTGESGVMYFMEPDGSELSFVLQGFVGSCLVVGPHIIARYKIRLFFQFCRGSDCKTPNRMKNKLSALQYKIGLVGPKTERFQESFNAYKKLHQFMDSHCRFRTLQPLKRFFVADGIECFTCATPLLDLVHVTDSPSIEVPDHLNQNGFMQRFLDRKTHVFTNDNLVDIVEVVESSYVI